MLRLYATRQDTARRLRDFSIDISRTEIKSYITRGYNT